MNKLFIVVSIFVFSLLIMQVPKYMFHRARNLHYLLVKYQAILIFIATVSISLIPFVLLFLVGNLITLNKIINIFISSLLISFVLAFVIVILAVILERLHQSYLKGESKNRKLEAIRNQPTREDEFDLKSKIGLETLERFGLSSSVGISFNDLNRLGNHFSEKLLLERDIDSLKSALEQ